MVQMLIQKILSLNESPITLQTSFKLFPYYYILSFTSGLFDNMGKYSYLVKVKLFNGEWATVGSSIYERNARNLAKSIEKEYGIETKVD